MLEAVAFQEHPDLVATFGSDGAAVAEILTRHRSSPARQGSTAVLAVLAILGVSAPVEQALTAPLGTLFTLDPIRRARRDRRPSGLRDACGPARAARAVNPTCRSGE